MEAYRLGGFLIREANEQDIPRLVEMGMHFHNGSPYREHIKENPQQMRNLAEQLVLNKGLLLSERAGKICGARAPYRSEARADRSRARRASGPLAVGVGESRPAGGGR